VISKSDVLQWSQVKFYSVIILFARFRPAVVKEYIHQILSEFFVGRSYDGEECTAWCKNISHEIKDKLKGDI